MTAGPDSPGWSVTHRVTHNTPPLGWQSIPALMREPPGCPLIFHSPGEPRSLSVPVLAFSPHHQPCCGGTAAPAAPKQLLTPQNTSFKHSQFSGCARAGWCSFSPITRERDATFNFLLSCLWVHLAPSSYYCPSNPSPLSGGITDIFSGICDCSHTVSSSAKLFPSAEQHDWNPC